MKSCGLAIHKCGKRSKPFKTCEFGRNGENEDPTKTTNFRCEDSRVSRLLIPLIHLLARLTTSSRFQPIPKKISQLGSSSSSSHFVRNRTWKSTMTRTRNHWCYRDTYPSWRSKQNRKNVRPLRSLRSLCPWRSASSTWFNGVGLTMVERRMVQWKINGFL